MNLKYVPLILINLILIINALLSKVDAKILIIFFFIEIFITTIFRSIINIKESKKSVDPKQLSERAVAITSSIGMILALLVILFIAGGVSIDSQNLYEIMTYIWNSIQANLWLTLSITVVEIYMLIKYFFTKEDIQYRFGYGIAKILVLFLLLNILGPVISIIKRIFEINPESESKLFLIIFIIATNIIIEYYMLRIEEEKKSRISKE